MTKIQMKKGEIEMMWCLQIFDCKFFTGFKIKKKCVLKTILRGKICIMLFIRTIVSKKDPFFYKNQQNFRKGFVKNQNVLNAFEKAFLVLNTFENPLR